VLYWRDNIIMFSLSHCVVNAVVIQKYEFSNFNIKYFDTNNSIVILILSREKERERESEKEKRKEENQGKVRKEKIKSSVQNSN